MAEMKLIILENEFEVDRYVSEHIVNLIKRSGNPTIGFATGATPIGCYKNLIDEYKSGRVSFKEVRAFNLDEYVGIAKDSPRSFSTFMKENFFNEIDIQSENIFSLNGASEKLEEECINYEKLIKNLPIDIQILGVGINGHIGYNEPFSDFEGNTHVVDLEAKSIISSLNYGFENVEDVPHKGITMGIGTIMGAKQLVMIAKGKKKAAIVRAMLQGKISEEVPASIIRRHNNVIVVLDKAAASELKQWFRL